MRIFTHLLASSSKLIVAACLLHSPLHCPLMARPISPTRSTSTQTSSIITAWKWDNQLHKIIGSSAVSAAAIQLDPPCRLQTQPLLYSYRNCLFLACTDTEHPLLRYFLSPKPEKWDFWIYTMDSGRWQVFHDALAYKVIQWVHQFSIQNILIGDVLIDTSDAEPSREWVRYWVNSASQQVQKTTIYRGNIEKIAIHPDPVNGTFRYAYLLLNHSTLIKFDLLRNSQRSIQLPIQAHSMQIIPSDPYYLEDDVRLLFKGDSTEVTVHGIQLTVE